MFTIRKITVALAAGLVFTSTSVAQDRSANHQSSYGTSEVGGRIDLQGSARYRVRNRVQDYALSSVKNASFVTIGGQEYAAMAIDALSYAERRTNGSLIDTNWIGVTRAGSSIQSEYTDNGQFTRSYIAQTIFGGLGHLRSHAVGPFQVSYRIDVRGGAEYELNLVAYARSWMRNSYLAGETRVHQHGAVNSIASSSGSTASVSAVLNLADTRMSPSVQAGPGFSSGTFSFETSEIQIFLQAFAWHWRYGMHSRVIASWARAAESGEEILQ